MRQVGRTICFVLADMVLRLMMLCTGSAACDKHWIIMCSLQAWPSPDYA